jgi:hypothetical protein
VIVYFEYCFLKIAEVSHIFRLLFSTANIMHYF